MQGGPQCLRIQLWKGHVERPALPGDTFHILSTPTLCSLQPPPTRPWLEDPPNLLHISFPALHRADRFIGHPQKCSPSFLISSVPHASFWGGGGGSGHLRGSARGPGRCSQRSEHGTIAQPDHRRALRGSPSSPPRTWPLDLLEMGALPWAPGLLRAPEV